VAGDPLLIPLRPTDVLPDVAADPLAALSDGAGVCRQGQEPLPSSG
jgi:hypothetical protein